MAKLSARGRSEVVRLEKERVFTPVDDDVVSSSFIDWERVTVALMSDGVILKKRDIRFRSDGRVYNYGWKSFGRFKDTVSERFTSAFEKVGYKRVVR